MYTEDTLRLELQGAQQESADLRAALADKPSELASLRQVVAGRP